MYLKNFEESRIYGIGFLERKLDPDYLKMHSDRIEFLETGTGSRSGCLLGLFSHCNVRAMLAYFHDGNIREMKYWFYLSAKARIMWIHETQGVISAEDFLWVLASDNEELIKWHCANRLHYESTEKPDNKTIVTTHEFFRLQTNRALNQEWGALVADCRRALSQPELFKKQLLPRLKIFEFWIALATGDKDAMSGYLLELCTPKQRYRSYQFESGLSNNLMVSLATLYAKLAWRAGYELDIDTPWIPKDWLPINPLDKYEDPWPFMQNFDIWQSFPEPFTKYSPFRPST